MSYDPYSDLVEAQARGFIESFDDSVPGRKTYGVVVGEGGDRGAFFDCLDERAELEQPDNEEYDVVVAGAGVAITRTR